MCSYTKKWLYPCLFFFFRCIRFLNTSSSRSANSVNVVKNSVSKSRSKSKNPFDAVLEKARAIFNNQLDRSPETKKEAIERVINAQTAAYTKDQFLAEYVERIARVLDSKSYCKKCNSLKMSSYNVVTHIAFEGVRKAHQVIENGLDSVYSNFLSSMEKPVFSIEELKLSDKRNLLEDSSNKAE